MAPSGPTRSRLAQRSADTRDWLSSHPRFADRKPVSWPTVILVVAMGFFAASAMTLIVHRHNYFGTFDYDLGIFDQGVWLVSHGDSFMTIRGLDFWGHHANVGLLLYAPFYWLGAGPNFLDTTMVIALTLGCVPLYRLGLHHLRNEWYALIPPLAFLLHFSTHFVIQESFHPEVLAVTPFLFAYLAAHERRWVAFGLWLALAVSFKEDIAVIAFMLGFVLLFRHHRKAGLITMAASAAWFVFVLQILLPAYTPEGAFYGQFYGELGSTPVEVIKTGVTDPTEVVDTLSTNDALGYVRDLNAPFGGLALLSPLTLLIMVPNLLINLLTAQSATTHAHYVAMPLAVTAVACVEGLGRVTRLPWRRFALGLVAVGAVSTSVVWGLAPYSLEYDQGFWPLEPNSQQLAMDAMVAVPPGDAHVTATYNIVPHLSHRRYIYTFPNPWKPSNWGFADEDPHDPTTVDWLVIDRRVLGDEDRLRLEEILATDAWERDIDTPDLLLAHRSSAETRS